jgi:hypothetical protein
MRSLISLTGSAECGLHAAAGAQLAQFYDLPCASWMSTESSVPDAQAGLEKTMTGLHHVLSGVNIIWGIGNLDSQQSMSMEMAAIDNDIAGQLLRAQRGVEVTDDTLALHVLEEVGVGGSYMMADHTLDNYREQLHYPDLIHRGERETWEKTGGKWLHEAAHERVAEILARPREELLSDEQEAELLLIEDRALERARTKGRKDERTKGLKDERTKGRKDQRTKGPKDERTKGLKDQRTDGQTQATAGYRIVSGAGLGPSRATYSAPAASYSLSLRIASVSPRSAAPTRCARFSRSELAPSER